MESHGFIKVPEGKLVRFKQGGKLIPGTENARFLLEEDINIIMSSSFSPVKESSGSAIWSMITKQISESINEDVGSFLGGQWKQFGFQSWTGTTPMETSITIVVSMNKNAYKDVVVPIMTLTKLCLPTDVGGGSLLGPGPSLSTSLRKDTIDEALRDEEGKIITVSRQLHCYIGSYLFRNIIVKSAQPTFSRQVDNYGYPISGRIQLSISTVYSATTNMIDEMKGGI